MLGTIPDSLIDKALELLNLRGTILDMAREITELMRTEGIPGAVVGGISVVLHGYVRTTQDIDIFVNGPLEPLAKHLKARGFSFDEQRREFVRDDIPIHLVTLDQLGKSPREFIEIKGILTVSLGDIIEMKIRSGNSSLLRAKDLGDAVGLIRRHRLTGEFARGLDKSVRPTFRKLVKALRAED